MSPKGSTSSTRNSTTPYPRRAAGQPKSSRQQFSACGACRMRRVRCDLKDLPALSLSGQQPSCSNCRERGIKCVDEFAEVKAVKLLRRGRRLQQVEAVYGKVTDDESPASSSAVPTPINTASILPSNQSSVIPQLQLEFLNSPFFRRLSVQRPIIEPTEFTARYFAHVKGSASLGVEGQMLAMLLVTWAASFGVNEYGVEEDQEPLSPTHSVDSNTSLEVTQDSDSRRRARVALAQAMVKEILGLIDVHGVLRHPTWDGVRILLLILPLTRDIQAPMDRLTMHEAILSQVYSLCSLENPSTVNSGQGPYCDALVRSRIFWYAHVHEGITTGLRGGRLFLDDDDLIAFKSTLPPQFCASAAASTSTSASSSLPSPTSPLSGDFPSSAFQDPRGHSRASLSYLLSSHYFSLALGVSSVCRRIHAILTGTRARRHAETGAGVNEESMIEIWDELERSWGEFESLRRGAGGAGAMGGGLIRGEDVERFVSGWQVFIFECHNVIREALKQQIILQSPHGSPALNPSSGSIHPPTTSQGYASAMRLHDFATRRCRQVLPRVLAILKRHLAVSGSGFFAWDAGLIHDGCFFAGLLLAQGELEMDDHDPKVKQEEGVQWDVDAEEGVEVCLRALHEMGWAFSKGAEREKTLRNIWETRVSRDNDIKRERSRRYVVEQHQQQTTIYQNTHHAQDNSHYLVDKLHHASANVHSYSRIGQQSQPLTLLSAGGQSRPHLPPLSVGFSYIDSAPSTITDDGSGGWSAYTPPTTSGSMTSTVGTHHSPVSSASSGSPTQHTVGLSHLPPTKNDVDYYNDLDPFSFSGDNASNSGLASPAWSPTYHHPQNHISPASAYLDPSVVFSRPGAVLASDSSDDGCPHFGSECRCFFH